MSQIRKLKKINLGMQRIKSQKRQKLVYVGVRLHLEPVL